MGMYRWFTFASWVWVWYSSGSVEQALAAVVEVAMCWSGVAISEIRTVRMVVVAKKHDMKEALAASLATSVTSMKPSVPSFWTMLSLFWPLIIAFMPFGTGSIWWAIWISKCMCTGTTSSYSLLDIISKRSRFHPTSEARFTSVAQHFGLHMTAASYCPSRGVEFLGFFRQSS